MLHQRITGALWVANHPGRLQPIDEITSWQLDASANGNIDRILGSTVTGPVGRTSWHHRRATAPESLGRNS
jgi:hypothetical protein